MNWEISGKLEARGDGVALRLYASISISIRTKSPKEQSMTAVKLDNIFQW